MTSSKVEQLATAAKATVDDLAARLRELIAEPVDRATAPGADPVPSLVELARILAAVDPASLRRLLAGRRAAVAVPGGQLVVELSDWTTLVMMQTRAWEGPLLNVCRRHLARGQTVLDIGAHIGSYTVFFASMVGAAGRVIAFEPLPANVELLAQTIELNGFGEVVTVPPLALSNEIGTARLFPFANVEGGADRYPAPSSMIHSLLRGDGYGATGVEVEVTTVDAYADAHQIETVDFIKIDTEGSEGRILEHAGALIGRSPNVTLLVEVHPVELAADGRSVAHVIDVLRSLSLEITDLAYDGRTVKRRELGPSDAAAGTHLLARRKGG